MREESLRSSKEQPIKEIIAKFLKAHSLDEKMKEMDVVSAWPELMGPAVAHRTKEIYIKNHVLYLSIDSSVMREELLNGKQIIIERINQFAEKEMIKNVLFN